MATRVRSVQHADLPPFVMPDRVRHDVTYFCTPAGQPGAPAKLGEREYWIRREDAERTLDDGVIRIVSPLDSASSTEIEITEEQEAWLAWMVKHQVEHVRLE
jgi:hypothetical protein